MPAEKKTQRYTFKGAAGEYVYANDFDRVQAENQALQARLTVQDQRDDDVKFLLMAIRSRSTDSVVIAWIDTALNPTAEAASHEE